MDCFKSDNSSVSNVVINTKIQATDRRKYLINTLLINDFYPKCIDSQMSQWWRGYEAIGAFIFADWDAKCHDNLQNSWAVSYNFKHMLTAQPGNPTSRYLSKGSENKCHTNPVFESLWWLYLQSPKIENNTNTIWPVNALSKWDIASRWTAIQNRNKWWINGSVQWDSESLC